MDFYRFLEGLTQDLHYLLSFDEHHTSIHELH